MRIGLAGFGSVGQEVARRLLKGDIAGVSLTAVSAADLEKARSNIARLGGNMIAVPLERLTDHADIVCECATAAAFPEIARRVLLAGKTLMTVSAAGIPNFPEMVELAEMHGGKVRVVSGGLPGLDSVRAVSEGEIRRIKLTSFQRPDSLAQEPYILRAGFDFSRPPRERVRVFEGTAREAALAFPRHFNVAITLSLAGAGYDKTLVEVWCDPAIPGAVLHVDVEADSADLTLESRNRPSESNPRTSRLVVPSIMAALRSIVEPIHVGT